MSKRIETLEQLDELLSPDYRFTLSWGSDKNALEKMSWHLIQSFSKSKKSSKKLLKGSTGNL